MRILITGAAGQLGQELQRALAAETLAAFAREELDVADAAAVMEAVAGFAPEVVIHAAAYTDTAGCEADPEQAFRVNALGTRNVALACLESGARLVYVSTNEVFDGARGEPYWEFDLPNPLNTYARSKLAGEAYVRDLVARSYIVRTAWIYGFGGENFVTKILRAADSQGELRVVTDEVATPTWARDLAEALAALIRVPQYGVYHLTNAGGCSRYDWARHILARTGRGHVPVHPTTMAEFGRGPRKPPYSVLRNFVGAAAGVVLRPWQDALDEFLAAAYPGEKPTG
ncbi:MAG TPA: dTDP-4-dehydrorhamnose reductase [Dehalococcoidia bacterium]